MTEQSTDVVAVSDEEAAAPAGLKERNLQFVLLKAIADAAAKELGRLRADHLTPLLERYDEDGSTAYKVRLPGATGADSLVATVTLSVPQDALEIADVDAFTAWCEANHPDAVNVETIPGEPERVEVIPATEDRIEKTLVSKEVTTIFKQLKVVEAGIVDPSTGTLVDGVTNVPGSRPKQFAVKYQPDGVEQIVGAYRAGKLDHVIAGTTLPEVGRRGELERRLEIVRAGEPTDLVDASSYGRLNGVAEHFDGGAVLPGHDWRAVPGDVAGELAAESGLPGEVAADMTAGDLARAALEDHADELRADYKAGLIGGSTPADEEPFDPGKW